MFSTYIQHSIIKAGSKVVVINLQTWKLKICTNISSSSLHTPPQIEVGLN